MVRMNILKSISILAMIIIIVIIRGFFRLCGREIWHDEPTVNIPIKWHDEPAIDIPFENETYFNHQ